MVKYFVERRTGGVTARLLPRMCHGAGASESSKTVADAANASSSVGSGVHVVLWSRMLQEFVSVMDGLVPVARPGADRFESFGYRHLS